MKHLMLIVKRSPRVPTRWLYRTLAGLLISTGPIGATYALGPTAVTAPGQISVQDGKLTAWLVATPLQQVMEELSRVSGARFRWLNGQAEEKPVSVEFTALPMPEALRRIFGEINFLLFYTGTGKSLKLTEIWISAKTQSRSASDSAAQSEKSMTGQTEPDAISVETLILNAVSAAELSRRVDAIARLGAYAQADPKVEGILSFLASSDGNSQVRAAAAEVLSGRE